MARVLLVGINERYCSCSRLYQLEFISTDCGFVRTLTILTILTMLISRFNCRLVALILMLDLDFAC